MLGRGWVRDDDGAWRFLDSVSELGECVVSGWSGEDEVVQKGLDSLGTLASRHDPPERV